MNLKSIAVIMVLVGILIFMIIDPLVTDLLGISFPSTSVKFTYDMMLAFEFIYAAVTAYTLLAAFVSKSPKGK